MSRSADVLIEFLERSPVLLEGPKTGRVYRFSGQSPVQAVDEQDATELVRSRFFRRV